MRGLTDVKYVIGIASRTLTKGVRGLREIEGLRTKQVCGHGLFEDAFPTSIEGG